MADFAYSPDFDYVVKKKYDVIISRFENGYEQRRLKCNTPLRTFSLQFTARDATEMAAVKTFYGTYYGSLTAFSISIEGADVTGRFVEDSFTWKRRAYNVYDYSFDFQETY